MTRLKVPPFRAATILVLVEGPIHGHPHMLRHACGYHLANKGKHTAEYSMLAPNRFKNL
jgi:integrase